MSGCSLEWFESLSALHDGEVSEEDAVRIASHVAACAPCRRAAALLGGVTRALAVRRDAPVPPPLEARARAVLAPRRRSSRRSSRRSRWGWRAAGVAAVAAAAVASFGAPSGLPPAMADELVTHHVRGFAREHLCDFESSDPEAVERWIEGELGYHATVQPPAGARLLGARTCSVDGTKTAALMYRRDSGEPMTVFVARPGSSAFAVASRLAHARASCAKAALGNDVCATSDGAIAVGRQL